MTYIQNEQEHQVETMSNREFLSELGKLIRDQEVLLLAANQSYQGYIEQRNGVDTDQTNILPLLGDQEANFIRRLKEIPMGKIGDHIVDLVESKTMKQDLHSQLNRSGNQWEHDEGQIDQAVREMIKNRSRDLIDRLTEVRRKYATNLVGFYALQEYLGYALDQNQKTDPMDLLDQIISGNVSKEIVTTASMFANLGWLETKPWTNQELTHHLVVEQYAKYSAENRLIDWRQIADAARVLKARLTDKNVKDEQEVDTSGIADKLNQVPEPSPQLDSNQQLMGQIQTKLADPNFVYGSAVAADSSWRENEKVKLESQGETIPDYLNTSLFTDAEAALIKQTPEDIPAESIDAYKEARTKFARNTSGIYSLWIGLQLFASRGEDISQKLQQIAEDSPQLNPQDKLLLCRFAHLSWLCDQPWLGREKSDKVNHFNNLSEEEQHKDWIQIQTMAQYYLAELNKRTAN